MLKIGCCIVLSISLLLLGNGCSAGIYGGLDGQVYYPEKKGWFTGDPGGRGAGMSRNTVTSPVGGFQKFNPKSGD